MDIAEMYIHGIKQAYIDAAAKEKWEQFESVIYGVSTEDIALVREEYPDIPDALIQLLKFVDGTYWREYEGHQVVFYFLGSDVFEYPYYLLSAKQILQTKNEAFEYYADYINRKYDDIAVDEKITNHAMGIKWLHFSDCMNNGGTSQLFIDFSPSEKGHSGQVVRFLHDPDDMKVIADNFEEYLQMLIDNRYAFIQEETIVT
ncbi:SMI1/KNR4 family protein [Pectinatus frisingensis]|uniref:SMI1/KNR4 family protein n=1 Tax=Pectinatus frisingensis TaxID=865 RepID=UPI003D8043EA